MEYYLAIDIGASSGRHILGSVQNGKIVLEEIYRFDNGMREQNGHLCWDFDGLFREIKNGLGKCKEINKIPKSVGIDTWGVDFVLLDEEGKVLGDSVGYRDHRTDGIKEKMSAYISQEELYERTGIQFQSFNTINQLLAIKEETPEHLLNAKTMLMTPDYFNYLLTGVCNEEYTIASTGQLLDVQSCNWDEEIIERVGLPKDIFITPKKPGTVCGNLKPEIADEVGFDCKVVMVASHDTASAVMAVPSLMKNALYISSGTWSLMGCEISKSSTSLESMQAGFTNEGGYGGNIRFLKNIMGLWMIQSVRKEIAPDMSFGEICEMAEKENITSIVDCNDECFLSPESMVDAIKNYCKEHNEEVPETISELACVIYNSLAKCYAKTKKQIEELTGTTFDRIYIIGGGSKADYLNKLTAKCAECEVSAGPAEATAIGNLVCQMIKEGEFANLNEARKCIIDSFAVKIYI